MNFRIALHSAFSDVCVQAKTSVWIVRDFLKMRDKEIKLQGMSCKLLPIVNFLILGVFL